MAGNQVKSLNTYNGRRDGTIGTYVSRPETLVWKMPLTRTPTLRGVFKTNILYKYLQNFITAFRFGRMKLTDLK